MDELKVDAWVRIGPLRDGDGHYAPRKIGKIQALCQGGLRAIVRIHRGCPHATPNTWAGEEMVDAGLCEVVCRPEWDRD